MAVLIKNGLVVTAEGEGKADVYLKGESIAAVGEDLSPESGDEGHRRHRQIHSAGRR